ncbi:DsbA family protein [Halopseudomonas sp.]|uniref:DsbA family protein n=1 Tax=Halopseudomonas sp. TaxID=2901191 RepID=UPI003002F10B|tara:strand:- start:2105 stop:2833 length:729 start_codon:yes stop_codon:yes gene_type:complete
MGESKRRQATGEPSPQRRKRASRSGLLWGVVVLVVAAALALAFYLSTPGTGPIGLPSVPADQPPFPAEADRFGVQLGDPEAPVVVREFADYQCPACARFAGTIDQLKREYIDTGNVRLVFFEMPLGQHANAMPAAMAARCAGRQDAYWGMHDALFANQQTWAGIADPLERFTQYAQDLGLHEGRFQRCMTSEQTRSQVEDSLAVAQQLRVASTPTVIVDNIPLTRSNWEQLSGVIEQQLARD